MKDGFDRVFEALSNQFGGLYARKFYSSGELPRGVILDEHYFFRVSNDAALLITLEEVSAGETRVELIACAAGAGLMDLSYGAHDSYVQMAKDYLTQSGFQLEVEKEINYFDRSSSTS